MSRQEDIYHEMITIEFESRNYPAFKELNISHDVKLVDVPNFPYQDYKIWNTQKSICNKEYKKLKQIEFDLRHNNER